jgi:hypothetical protein
VLKEDDVGSGLFGAKTGVGSGKREAGRWETGVGGGKLEVGSWKTEDGRPETGVGGGKLEAGSGKLEVRWQHLLLSKNSIQ